MTVALAPILARKNNYRVQHSFPQDRGYIAMRESAKRAHVWTGTDTVCRMASTGGLNLRKFDWMAETSLPLCGCCTRLIDRDAPALVWPELIAPAISTEGQ